MPDPNARSRRKGLLVLVALVLAVDAAAIAIFLLTDLRHGSPTTQFLFAIVWTAVTVAVVVRGIKNVLPR